MISFHSVSYRTGKVYLFDDVSTEVPSGLLNIILGPNGAGKSTLVNLASGQLRTTSGKILLDQKPLSSFSHQKLARCRAVLAQQAGTIQFPMTAGELVMMGRSPHYDGIPAAKDRDICEEALAFMDIIPLKDRNYFTLSGGERQRVHFARVISQIWPTGTTANRYLFLDEPLSYLDVYYQYFFMRKLRQLLSNDLTVIAIIHDINIAAKYADNILLLKDGKLIAQGAPRIVLTSENIMRTYNLEPEITFLGNDIHVTFPR